MKKTYMAPVMESEEFLANEYVASCFSLRCKDPYIDLIHCDYNGKNGSKPVIIKGENLDDAVSKASFDIIHKGQGFSWVDHPVGGEDTNKYYHVTNVELRHHELEIKEIVKVDDVPGYGPNAS